MAVLVSHSENFGFAAVEALAHKVPVLLSPQVGIGELVRKYDAGVICEAEPQILAAQLHAWLTNPQRLKDAGEAGRALVEDELSLHIYGQRMRQLYSKVLTNRQLQQIQPLAS
jgi:glycosyltransferase involved in cell wall biosynthesis